MTGGCKDSSSSRDHPNGCWCLPSAPPPGAGLRPPAPRPPRRGALPAPPRLPHPGAARGAPQRPLPLPVSPGERRAAPMGAPHPLPNASFLSFDAIYGAASSTAAVYEGSVRPLLSHLLAGRDVTVLAYGPSGSGERCHPPAKCPRCRGDPPGGVTRCWCPSPPRREDAHHAGQRGGARLGAARPRGCAGGRRGQPPRHRGLHGGVLRGGALGPASPPQLTPCHLPLFMSPPTHTPVSPHLSTCPTPRSPPGLQICSPP